MKCVVVNSLLCWQAFGSLVSQLLPATFPTCAAAAAAVATTVVAVVVVVVVGLVVVVVVVVVVSMRQQGLGFRAELAIS